MNQMPANIGIPLTDLEWQSMLENPDLPFEIVMALDGIDEHPCPNDPSALISFFQKKNIDVSFWEIDQSQAIANQVGRFADKPKQIEQLYERELSPEEQAAADELQRNIFFSQTNAFNRVKEWQLDLYQEQIDHIMTLITPDARGVDQLSIHYLAAFLRGYAEDVRNGQQETAPQAVLCLTEINKSVGGMDDFRAETSSHAQRDLLKTVFEQAEISNMVFKELWCSYNENHIEDSLSDHSFLSVDIVSRNFIESLITPNSMFADDLRVSKQKDRIVLHMTTGLQELSETAGVQATRRILQKQASALEHRQKLLRKNTDANSIADLISAYASPRLQTYVYEDVIGLTPGTMEYMRMSPYEKPEQLSEQEWQLAQAIIQSEQTASDRRTTVAGYFFNRILQNKWNEYFSSLGTAEDVWDVLNPVEFYWEKIGDDVSFVAARLSEDTSERYLGQKLVRGEDERTPEYVGVREAVPVHTLAAPQRNADRQLEILKQGILPTFEMSLQTLADLQNTKALPEGKQVTGFVYHLLELAVAGFAAPRKEDRFKLMSENIRKFLYVVFNGADIHIQYAEYFTQMFKQLLNDSQVSDWIQNHQTEIDRSFDFEWRDGVPHMLRVDGSVQKWTQQLLAENNSVSDGLVQLDDPDATIDTFGYSFRGHPVTDTKRQLHWLEEKTETCVEDINNLSGSDAVFALLTRFCPSEEGKAQLLSAIGVDYSLMHQTAKPKDSDEAQWRATREFASQFEVYQRREGQAQMVSMGVFMFACTAAAFVHPFAGYAALGLGVGVSAVDIERELAKLDRVHAEVAGSHQSGAVPLAGLNELLAANLDFRDACWNGAITAGSMLLNIQAARTLSLRVPQHAYRIPLDVGFSVVDGVASALVDQRVDRSGTAMQAAFMAALFSSVAPLGGELVGGHLGVRPRVSDAWGTRASYREFYGEVGELPDGKLGFLIDTDDQKFVMEIDTKLSLAYQQDGQVLLARQGNQEIRFLGMDPETGRARFVALDTVQLAGAIDGPSFMGNYEVMRYVCDLDGEVEIFMKSGNPPEYRVSQGDSGRRDMGETVIAVSDEGEAVSVAVSSEARNPFGPEFKLAGHAHSSGKSGSVEPSVDDLVRFFQECEQGNTETFIVRVDQETGQPSWSQLFLDDAGNIVLKFGEAQHDTPLVRERFAKRLAQAREDYAARQLEGDTALRAVAETEAVARVLDGQEHFSDYLASDPAVFRERAVSMPPSLTKRLITLRPGDRNAQGSFMLIGRHSRLEGVDLTRRVAGENPISANHARIYRDEVGDYYVEKLHQNGFTVVTTNGMIYTFLEGACLIKKPDGSDNFGHFSSIKLHDDDVVIFPNGESFVFQRPPVVNGDFVRLKNRVGVFQVQEVQGSGRVLVTGPVGKQETTIVTRAEACERIPLQRITEELVFDSDTIRTRAQLASLTQGETTVLHLGSKEQAAITFHDSSYYLWNLTEVHDVFVKRDDKTIPVISGENNYFALQDGDIVMVGRQQPLRISFPEKEVETPASLPRSSSEAVLPLDTREVSAGFHDSGTMADPYADADTIQEMRVIGTVDEQSVFDHTTRLSSDDVEVTTSVVLHPEEVLEVHAGNVRFSKAAVMPDGSKLTYALLQKAGLTPKTKFIVEGREIWLSDFCQMDTAGHVGAIAYIKSPDGQWSVRAFYRSNSHTAWKLMSHYALDDFGNVSWYGKGVGEESVCLPISCQEAIYRAYNEQGRPRQISPVDGISVEKIFAGTAKEKAQGFPVMEFMDGNMTFAVDVNESGLPVHESCYPSETQRLARPDKMHIGTEPNSAQEPALLSNPEHAFRFHSDLYGGEVVGEVFTSADGKLRYLFFRDKLNRVWIGAVEPAHSRVTTNGVYANWIDTGSLTTPAFERKRGHPAEYRNDKLTAQRGVYVDMFDKYLRHVPIIQRYYEERGIPMPISEALKND